MIFQPIFHWSLVLALAILSIGFFGWIIYNGRHDRSHARVWLRRLAVLLMLVAIMFRPMIPGESKFTGNSLLDVYFVVDKTMSMRVRDMPEQKSRIERAKQDIAAIAEKLPGARFSLITFSTKAIQELPLTVDSSALTTAAEVISTTNQYVSTGSSISQPLGVIKDELNRSRQRSPDRGRIVFYLGDGEQTIEDSPASFKLISGLIAGGAVLGYGTTSGGKIPFMDYDGVEQPDEFVVYYGENAVADREPYAISKASPDALSNIAQQMGVRFFDRTAPESIEQVIEGINTESIIKNSREVDSYMDIYWIFAVVATGLMLPDLRRLRNTAQQLSRLVKTKGWT